MDTRVSHSHWGRYGCNWTLEGEPQTWEDIKAAFRLIHNIMSPHIIKFERTLSLAQDKEETSPVNAQFKLISNTLELNLQIPEYQRPYRWTIKNVEQLLNDIRQSQSC